MLFSKKAVLKVLGMSCEHCEKTVEEGLSEVSGVTKVEADHAKDQVTVRYRGECPSIDVIKTKVSDLGYEAEGSWV